MTHLSNGPPGDLPDSRTLLRSTAIAVIVAAVLLVTTVLPAEYGVDPTGVGRVLGLKQMGDIKVALAKEAALEDSIEASGESLTGSVTSVPDSAPLPTGDATGAVDTASHVTVVVLQPDEGKEVKLTMRKDARANYAWSTDRGVVNYDTHGDSANAPNSYFNYKKGSGAASDEGSLTAAFEGKHGWFWRNRTREVVTITLRTSGEYHSVVRTN